MSAGSKIWGYDPLSGIWRKIRVMPDGSLATSASMVVDQGIATGGTPNTLIDATKDWDIDIYEGGFIQFTHGAITYTRLISANAATSIGWDNATALAPAAGDVYRIVISEDPMSPLSRATIHNTAYVTPADFLGAAIAGIVEPTLFRCQGAFTVAGVLSATITRGGNTQVVNFNHGVVLEAGCLFEFDCLVQLGTTINYRYSVNCTIQTFSVLEIPSAI